jgi:surface antigen
MSERHNRIEYSFLNIAWEHKNQGMVGDVVPQKRKDVGGTSCELDCGGKDTSLSSFRSYGFLCSKKDSQ